MDRREHSLEDLLTRPLAAINLGLQAFGEALEGQGVEVVYVDWSPPAGGDQEMIDLLDALL
jgi:hypothetical protein